MNKKNVLTVGAIVVGVIAIAAALYFKPDYGDTDSLSGASVPVVVSLFETSLQSSISSSDTSMTLVSGTDRAGNSLSGFMCFTIDEGTSVAEFVCGTASSTSVSSLTRGISPTSGTSSVASLKFSHRRGASVKITDYPQLTILSRIINGDETLPNKLSYDPTIATSTFTTYNVVNKQYVDGVALQGSPTATSTIPGVVQIGTASEIGAGIGMTGQYTLVPAGSLFSSTFRSATTVPVTGLNGYLSQGFLDLTAAWAFTGTTTLAATTSAPLIIGGVSYTFPTSQGGATTTLVNNGSGSLSWGTMPGFAAATTTMGQTDITISATTVVASLTVTPSVAQRLMLNGGARVFNTTNGGDCYFAYTVDNAATTTVAGFKYTAGQEGTQNLSFGYITDQVSAAQHTVKLIIYPITGGCTITTGNAFSKNYFNALYIGN